MVRVLSERGERWPVQPLRAPGLSSEDKSRSRSENTCTCRRHAISPLCSKHGIGKARYLLNLTGMCAVVCALAVAVFTAPAEAGQTTRAICKVFKRNCAAAVRVARCESHLNPRAVGRAGERGIFQIHPVHFGWARPGRLFEPRWNALVAYRLSRGGTDWGHWTCGWAA